MSVNNQTDTDDLNIVVYQYQNNLHLKKSVMDLKRTEYGTFILNESFFSITFDVAMYCTGWNNCS